MKKFKYFLKYVKAVIDNSYGWNKITFFKNKYIKLLSFPLLYIFYFFINLNLFINNKKYIPYLEIVITTKCSLKCKYCSNFIPYFENKEIVNNDALLKQINNLFNKIDYIDTIRLLGGEPFLNPKIDIIIRKVLETKKVKNIYIVTNGTINIKKKELLNTLNNKNIIISISDYKFVNNDELINTLNKNKIKFLLNKYSFWQNFGQTEKQNKNQIQLQNQFNKCKIGCRSYFNGKLFYCAQSSALYHLGKINSSKNYIDFSTEEITSEKLINFLMSKCYQDSCAYCNRGTEKFTNIDVAEQK